MGRKLAEIFRGTWLWIIVLAVLLICTVSIVLVWFILLLPSVELRLIATFLLIIGWGVAAGYKDWIIAKHKEEEKKKKESSV